jgi:hypothetical protein
VIDKREWIWKEAIVANSKVGVHLKGWRKTKESLNHVLGVPAVIRFSRKLYHLSQLAW